MTGGWGMVPKIVVHLVPIQCSALLSQHKFQATFQVSGGGISRDTRASRRWPGGVSGGLPWKVATRAL